MVWPLTSAAACMPAKEPIHLQNLPNCGFAYSILDRSFKGYNVFLVASGEALWKVAAAFGDCDRLVDALNSSLQLLLR